MRVIVIFGIIVNDHVFFLINAKANIVDSR